MQYRLSTVLRCVCVGSVLLIGSSLLFCGLGDEDGGLNFAPLTLLVTAVLSDCTAYRRVRRESVATLFHSANQGGRWQTFPFVTTCSDLDKVR